MKITTDIVKPIWISIGLCVIYVSLLPLVVDIFPLREPDSSGYIDFSAIRSSFYPIFLEFFNHVGIPIDLVPFVQVILFLLSLIYVTLIMQKHYFPLWMIIIFTFSITFNIYYNAYHFTILTESLSFSAMMVLLGHIISYAYKGRLKDIILIGIIIGVLTGLRPNLFAFVPAALLIIGFANWGNGRSLMCHLGGFGLGFMIMVLVEISAFYAYHDQRNSLIPVTMLGKATILTTDKSFKSPELETVEEKDLMRILTKAMEPVKQWRTDESNPFLRAIYLADYEVFGQYTLLGLAEFNPEGRTFASETKRSVGLKAIQANPWPYLNLSLHHYLGLWSVHGVTFFKTYSDQTNYRPFFDDGDIEKGFDYRVIPLSGLVFPAFLALGIFINGLAFYYILQFLNKDRWQLIGKTRNPASFLSMSLVILVLAILTSTALVNISTPRYLMTVYPYAVLAFLIVFSSFLPWIKNSYFKSRFKI